MQYALSVRHGRVRDYDRVRVRDYDRVHVHDRDRDRERDGDVELAFAHLMVRWLEQILRLLAPTSSCHQRVELGSFRPLPADMHGP